MAGKIDIGYIQSLVLQGLERSGLSQQRASLLATGTKDALRAISYGRMPSVDRWQAICHVLGIPFHTGFGAGASDSQILCHQILGANGLEDGEGQNRPDLPVYLTGGRWHVIEIGEDGCAGGWQPGDRLFFEEADPLAQMPERLIGLWCLVEMPAPESRQLLGRCRRSDDGNSAHINLEDPAGGPTRTNLKPLKTSPLRLVVPKV